MTDLPSELRTLVQRYGTHVLDDADGLRATLDDFLDEDSNPGDVNLLVDAVRFGSLVRLKALLEQGAEPSAAMVDVAEALALRRGGDAESAYWACAVLGYAADLLPGDLVPGSWERPPSLFPPSHPAVEVISIPPSASSAETTNTARHVDPRTADDNQADWLTNGVPTATSAAEGNAVPPAQLPPTHDEGPVARDSSGGRTKARSRRRGILAAAAVLVLLVAGGVAWWLQHDDDATPAAATHDPAAHDPAMSTPAVSLVDAVHAANQANPGLLPIDKCHTQEADHFACVHPHDGVDTVELMTYTSPSDLYDDYSSKVKSLNHGDSIENQDDCNATMTGEVSWNHIGEHSSKYSLAETEMGDLGDDEAVGRVFCTLQRGVLKLVWTDNNIKMLGYITGTPQSKTYNWWRNEHHHFETSMSDDPSSDQPSSDQPASDHPSSDHPSSDPMTDMDDH